MLNMPKAIEEVSRATIFGGERKATKYLNSELVVKASRRNKPRCNERTAEIVLTVGKPNYAEREFIKAAKKRGEPFPIKQVQLLSWK